MKNKSQNLENKLLKYSLTAGALLIGTTTVNAQIWGYDVDPDVTIDDGQSLDITFNGQHTFTIMWETGPRGSSFICGAGYLAPITGSASWIQTGNRPKAIGDNYVISSGRSFSRANERFCQIYYYSFISGSSFDGGDKYLGVRFKIGENTHYGWILVNVDNWFPVEMTIKSYAYEQTPGLGIEAGETTTSLPVELISFNAQLIQNNVQLNWQTATEVDNYGFSIERTSPLPSSYLGGDGDEVGRRGWETIGFVNGHGNSNSPKSYSFTDDKPVSGKIHYRLKQIDNDGKFEYSNVVTVDLGTPNKFALNQNYPNPFNPTTAISFTIAEKGFVNLTVYNTLGEKVAVLINQQMEAGNYQQDFNAESLSSGTYIYKITVDDKFTAEKKMMVLK